MIVILFMMRAMNCHNLYIAVLLICLNFTVAGNLSAENLGDSPLNGLAPAALHLKNGVMCEAIENYKPIHPSTVFSVGTGKVMCFTEFDHVPVQMDIYHDWIKRGELVFRKKLVLNPPRWSSVSSIQLREADKGPWRVEIRSVDGRLLELLRFSITD